MAVSGKMTCKMTTTAQATVDGGDTAAAMAAGNGGAGKWQASDQQRYADSDPATNKVGSCTANADDDNPLNDLLTLPTMTTSSSTNDCRHRYGAGGVSEVTVAGSAVERLRLLLLQPRLTVSLENIFLYFLSCC